VKVRRSANSHHRALCLVFGLLGDALFWSRRTGRHRYRLMMLCAQTVTRLPVQPNYFPFFASAGTDAAGAPMLVYTRCRHPKCRSLDGLSLTQGRERRLPVRAGRGCELFSPSIDRGVLAFVRDGRCAGRGVWIRSADGRLKRLTRNADVCCTAVVGTAAAWIGSPAEGLVDLVVAPAGGRPFELFRSDSTYPLDLYIGNLSASGGLLYWSVSTWKRRARAATDARIYRAAPTRLADCEATDRQIPTRPQSSPAFAVNEAGVRYATRKRILLADSPPLAFGAEHSPFPAFTGRVGRGCWAF
jgi:hypothetical protein